MKSAVTISLVPEAKGGPFVFWDGLEAGCRHAGGLGFDAVEIFPPSADALNVKEIQTLVSTHGLRVAAIGSGAGWVKHKLRLTDPDAGIRRAARKFIGDLIEAAGELGAPVIIGSMQGRTDMGHNRPEVICWLEEALVELGNLAARQGQVLLYEALNRYETDIFTRQSEAAAFIRGIHATHVRLLCDLFHMNIEEKSMAEALVEVGPFIGHVHWADSNRQAMGWGHSDAGAIVKALRSVGYRGYLSAEIFPVPDSLAAAQRSLDSFRRWVSPA